jgi:hypothetical protein
MFRLIQLPFNSAGLICAGTASLAKSLNCMGPIIEQISFCQSNCKQLNYKGMLSQR